MIRLAGPSGEGVLRGGAVCEHIADLALDARPGAMSHNRYRAARSMNVIAGHAPARASPVTSKP